MILDVSKTVHVKKNYVSMHHEGLKVFYDCYHVESQLVIPIYNHYLKMKCYFCMCHLIVEKGLLLYHRQYAYCCRYVYWFITVATMKDGVCNGIVILYIVRYIGMKVKMVYCSDHSCNDVGVYVWCYETVFVEIYLDSRQKLLLIYLVILLLIIYVNRFVIYEHHMGPSVLNESNTFHFQFPKMRGKFCQHCFMCIYVSTLKSKRAFALTYNCCSIFLLAR